MTKYYTGTGDKGDTSTLSAKVPKSSSIIEAIGAVDELNSAIGVAYCKINDSGVKKELEAVQNDLFIIGAGLAGIGNENVKKAMINEGAVNRLEGSISELSKELPELKAFVIPGGSEAAASLHLARAIARRAERSIVRAADENKVADEAKAYLNRLSSYLFVASLYVNMKAGAKERNPTY